MIDTALRCMASARGKLESKDFRCLAFQGFRFGSGGGKEHSKGVFPGVPLRPTDDFVKSRHYLFS